MSKVQIHILYFNSGFFSFIRWHQTINHFCHFFLDEKNESFIEVFLLRYIHSILPSECFVYLMDGLYLYPCKWSFRGYIKTTLSICPLVCLCNRVWSIFLLWRDIGCSNILHKDCLCNMTYGCVLNLTTVQLSKFSVIEKNTWFLFSVYLFMKMVWSEAKVDTKNACDL